MEQKTPWNPSKTAIARVKDQLPAPTICRFCEGDVRIVNHTAIYGGRTYGEWPWAYRCECCEARVGMHPFTNLPLGTLADESLRAVRNACKKPFELLWQSGAMRRGEAYRWLGQAMRKSVAECHFGLFEAAECEQARDLCLLKQQELAPALMAKMGGQETALSRAFQNAGRGRQ